MLRATLLTAFLAPAQARRFSPLTSCAVTDMSSCTPWSPTLVDIPCGTCTVIDEDGVYSVDGMLNIEGHLLITSGINVEIRAEGIAVQGELTVETPAATVPSAHQVRFVLSGDRTFSLAPHADNAAECPTPGDCDLGLKPFAVAGGLLRIQGLPETCPTWVKLKAVEEDPMPLPALDQAPEVPAGCARDLVQGSFEDGLGGWYGDVPVAVESGPPVASEGSSYLALRQRTQAWHKAKVDVDVACLVADEPYIFHARVMGLAAAGASDTECAASDGSSRCISAGYSFSSASSGRRWHWLGSQQTFATAEWATISTTVVFSAETLADMVAGSMYLYLDGAAAGEDILVDDVHLEMPPASARVDSCANLLGNPDMEASAYSPYPWASTQWPPRLGVEHEADEGGTDHRYIRAYGRTASWNSVTQALPTACFEAGVRYHFRARVRLAGATLANCGSEGSGDCLHAFVHTKDASGKDHWDTIAKHRDLATDWVLIEGAVPVEPKHIGAQVGQGRGARARERGREGGAEGGTRPSAELKRAPSRPTGARAAHRVCGSNGRDPHR